MLALGVTGGSVYFLAENAAMLYTTATNTSLIVCSCPLFTMLLVALFYRKTERFTRRQVTGSLMACLGMAVVVLNGRFVLHLSPAGDALALAANLCWAFYSLLLIPVNSKYDAVFITRKVFFYGLLTMTPYYLMRQSELPLFMEGTLDLHVLLQPEVLTNLLFLGCVASMLCFLLWTWVMRKLGAVVATNYVYINPIATVVFAWWILSEQITPFFVLGSVLILMGMYLADRKR
jgi:drug/metabolite transporter (DMT)-like permease